MKNFFRCLPAITMIIVTAANAQIITTIAGNGIMGYSGDGGPATAAELYGPWGVTVDRVGNLYIADVENARIRKVNPSGIITTVAGNGIVGYGGDGGPATAAELYTPLGLAVDDSGNLYIADPPNERIRKVSLSGIISTVAGNGTVGYSGDGGPAAEAQLNDPTEIAVDGRGNLYIADFYNSRIRKVSSEGIITTVAGNGGYGYYGDGGQATAAELNYPFGVAVDGSGNLYISDGGNRIRKVNASGIISTVAGNGKSGYSGDGGAAIAAELNEVYGVAVDRNDNLYISDEGNERIRQVNPSGIISTVAGNGIQGYSGDGGAATAAELNYAINVAIDSSGNLYIADSWNSRVRKVNLGALPLKLLSFVAQAVTGSGAALKWQTANETNTDDFVVERSADGQTFTPIGTVVAKGTSNNSYSYNDKTPLATHTYYHLKMVDKDGGYTYSNVVELSANVTNEFAIYPNPATDVVNVQFTDSKTENVTVQIIDMLGKVLQDLPIALIAGSNSFSLLVGSLSRGSYVVVIKGEMVEHKRFVKE